MVMQAAAPPVPEHYRRLGFVESGRDDCLAVAPMTFDEYLALDQEAGLVEWVNGEARLYMSANNKHQMIALFLSTLLRLFAEVTGSGVVRTGPYAMRPRPGMPAREPDVLFVRSEHAARITQDYLDGPADLVIEIISPDSTIRDSQEKFLEYESSGIPEYWLIDARPGRQAASFYQLRDGRYVPIPVDDAGYYTSAVLPGFRLQVDRLWDDEPAVMPALQEALAAAEAAETSQPAE